MGTLIASGHKNSPTPSNKDFHSVLSVFSPQSLYKLNPNRRCLVIALHFGLRDLERNHRLTAENAFLFLEEQVASGSKQPFTILYTPPGEPTVRYLGSCDSRYWGAVVRDQIAEAQINYPLPRDILLSVPHLLSCMAAKACKGDFDRNGLCPVDGCGRDRKEACIIAGIGGSEGEGCICVQSYPSKGDGPSLCKKINNSDYCPRFYCTKTPDQLIGDTCTSDGNRGCHCKRIDCNKNAYPVCNAGCAGNLCCAETQDNSCSCFTECNNRKPNADGTCGNYPCLNGGSCNVTKDGKKCECVKKK